MARTFYDILGVDREATKEQIKKAYRKLAMECHPDKNPDNSSAEQLFRELSTAYQILFDDEKRVVYDAYGAEAFNSGDFQSPLDLFQEIFGTSGVFEQFFGGKVASTRPQRGEDINCIMEIELEETITGCEREASITRVLTCTKCDGNGKTAKSAVIQCHICRGSGKITAARGMSISQNCPNCGGSGNVVKDPCGTCRGTGQAKQKCMVKLKIPPGIVNGAKLKNIGGGDAGRNGGKAGNLYIQVEVVPHPIFTQIGKDILAEMNIPLKTAIFGGEIEIPTLSREEEKTITIPEGVQGGSIIKVANEGTFTLDNPARGDLQLKINIELPALTPEQKNKLYAILT